MISTSLIQPHTAADTTLPSPLAALFLPPMKYATLSRQPPPAATVPVAPVTSPTGGILHTVVGRVLGGGTMTKGPATGGRVDRGMEEGVSMIIQARNMVPGIGGRTI